MFALKVDGVVIKRHPHRLTCIIEAVERKLVFQSVKSGIFIPEGVKIEEELT